MNGLDEIRIGIIGVGLMGNLHNQAIQTIIEESYLDDNITVSVEAICDTRFDYIKEMNTVKVCKGLLLILLLPSPFQPFWISQYCTVILAGSS